MDKELNSSRFHPGTHNYDDHKRHNHRRGGGYRRGGGGYNRHHPHTHGHHRHDSRRGRGGRGGGGGNRSNRVSTSSTKVDPTKAMLAQLTGMVAKIGDLSSVTEDIVNVVENAQNLASVLCGDNAELFLSFEKPSEGNNGIQAGQESSNGMEVENGGEQVTSNVNGGSNDTAISKVIKPIDAAGPTAALIVHCAASLPLQTPAYVTLTKEIELSAPDSHANFAQRCVTYALDIVQNDLKSLVVADSSTDVLLRLKLLMRYLCMLEKIGILTSDESSCCDEICLNMIDLVKDENTNTRVKLSLLYLLLSSLPYYATIKDENIGFATEVIDIVESSWLPRVKKLFAPGIGVKAIYLKVEQKEEEDEEDEEEESDEEMEDDDDNAIYESFSELFLAVKDLSENEWNAGEMGQKLIITSDLTQFEMTPISNSITIDWVDLKSSQNSEQRTLLESVPSVISPRLPLSDAETNETTKTFYDSSSRLDRALLAQHIRDILFAFKPRINPHGVQMGGVKLAAEQVSSISKLVPSSEGLEYFVVDILLSLIVQNSNDEGIYFSRVLLELCKLNPDKVPLALALGVGSAVTDLPTLVPSVRCAFSEWFSFHLTNTDYQWPYWKHWEDEPNDENVDYQNSCLTRHVFLRQIMTQMSMLYKIDVIEDRVGTTMAKFIEKASFVSELIDENNGSPLACLTRELLERIRTRQPVEELTTWLTSSSEHSDVAEATQDYKFWRVVSAIHAILAASQQDLVETQVGIERYNDLLKQALKKDQEETGVDRTIVEMEVLNQVWVMWQSSAMRENITEELLRYGVVGNSSILGWKVGGKSTIGVNVDQFHFNYSSNVHILKSTVHILLDVLENDMKDSMVDASKEHEIAMDRVADFLLSLCCQIASLVIDPGCSQDGRNEIVKQSKRSPILVALTESLKDICSFAHEVILQSNILSQNVDLKQKVSGSRMADALRGMKSSNDPLSDNILEELAICLETCL